MKREISKTFDGLVKLFISKMTQEEAEAKANEVINDSETQLRYYVTLFDFSLSDITMGAMVKTPAKYFESLTHAKLFQVKSVINWVETADIDQVHAKYTYHEIEDMYTEYKQLSTEFPEYDL